MVLNKRRLKELATRDKAIYLPSRKGMIFKSSINYQQTMIVLPTVKFKFNLSLLLVMTSLFITFTRSIKAQTDSLQLMLGKLGKNAYKVEPSTQGADTTGTNAYSLLPGKITVKADSAIVQLEKSNRKFKDIKGYRVQIYLGSVEQVKAERNKYLSLGLPYSVYSKQIVPEQALLVGDFMSRMEMEKNLEVIRRYYPKAFGVLEAIEPPKFSATKKR